MLKESRRAILFSILIVVACRAASKPAGYQVLDNYAGERVNVSELQGGGDWPLVSPATCRSLLLYSIDAEENLTPESVPNKQALSPLINTFACPGQYKACAVVLRTLAAANELHAEFSDLKSDLSVIEAVNCDLRIVKYISASESKDKKLEGRWLEKFDSASLPKNYTAWLWMTIFIPENTEPGSYRGTLKISDLSGESVSISVRLKVLNFKLKKPANSYGAYLPGHFYMQDKGCFQNFAVSQTYNAANIERYFKYWKTRGFNSPTLYHVYPDLKCVDGKAVANFSQLSQFACAMKSAGLEGDLCVDVRWIEWWAQSVADKLDSQGGSVKGDLGVYGFDCSENPKHYTQTAKRLFTEAVTQLIGLAEKENWPFMRLLPEEEMCCGETTLGKVAGYEAFMPILQKIAPERAYVVDNSVGYEKWNPDVIDRATRDKVLLRQFNNWTSKAIADGREQNSEIRSYNLGWFRSSFGFLQARLGSTGYHVWADNWASRSEGEIERHYAMIMPDGIVSSVQMERAREGIDDGAYCYTLSDAADMLEKKGKTASAKYARRVLDEVVKDVPVDRFEYFDWQKKITQKELDQRRYKLAVAIEKAFVSLSSDLQIKEPNDANEPSSRSQTFKSAIDANSSSEGKKLTAIKTFDPATIDGKIDEYCWNQKSNSTGPLWYIGKDEGILRARASSSEEFKKLYMPELVEIKVAYDKAGLYFAVHSEDSWADGYYLINLLHENSDAKTEIKFSNAGVLAISKNGVICSSSSAKLQAFKTEKGTCFEIFIPWKLLETEMPAKDSQWSMQAAYFGKHILTWATSVSDCNESTGKIVFGSY